MLSCLLPVPMSCMWSRPDGLFFTSLCDAHLAWFPASVTAHQVAGFAEPSMA